MLKDFLELDANSDSCSSFHCVPRRRIATPADAGAPTSIRFLLEAELNGGGDHRRSLPRSRSKGSTLTKITAAINNAVKHLPISSPTRIRPKARAGAGAKPAAVLRKLLGRSFWRRSDEVEEKVRVKDIVRLNSFELYGERRTSLYFPSPIASSCSSCSGASDNNSSSSSSSSVSDSLLSSASFFDCSGGVGETKRKDSSLQSPAHKTSLSSGNHNIKEEENKEGGDSEIEQEEKEQLSPASVIDFPFQEEEEDKEDDDDEDENGNNEATSSPRFEQSLANIERTRHQLLQKIRRFECLADLDSVDLSENFPNFDDHVSSEEEEEDDDDEDVSASSLIRRLRSVGPHKKLLHDFFREELTWTTDLEGLLRAAECCIEGGGHLAAQDHGKAQVEEMERNGRWRCFEDDTKEVATEVEARMLGALLEELVLDLVSWS